MIFTIVRRRDFSDFLAEIDSVDVNIVNDHRQNLLHQAAAWKRLDCTVELLKKGIDVDHVEYRGMTPLHYAAAHSQFEIAELILEARARVDIADDYGNEVLWTAAVNARGEYRLVKALVAAGADPHHQNKVNKSPMDVASEPHDQGLIAALSGS